jgi:hypothetical protein
MGMFSEANAADNAERLEKILLEAIHSGNDGVKEFAKKHLYQWYCLELGETWGAMKENPEIEQAFKTQTLVPHNINGTMFTTNE